MGRCEKSLEERRKHGRSIPCTLRQRGWAAPSRRRLRDLNAERGGRAVEGIRAWVGCDFRGLCWSRGLHGGLSRRALVPEGAALSALSAFATLPSLPSPPISASLPSSAGRTSEALASPALPSSASFSASSPAAPASPFRRAPTTSASFASSTAVHPSAMKIAVREGVCPWGGTLCPLEAKRSAGEARGATMWRPLSVLLAVLVAPRPFPVPS